MSEKTKIAATTPASKIAATTSVLLRRKCACGGSSGSTGACSDCEKPRLLRQPLQTKLRINEPGDECEQEADRVAEQVMRMPVSPMDRNPSPPSTIPLVQRRVSGSGLAGAGTAPQMLHDVLNSPGQPLDAATRAFFEARFDHDFGAVRVHADRDAAASALLVQARAYTVGTDLVFGDGGYVPGTASGRRLLAHELTHVVQQGQGDTQGVLQRASGTDPELPGGGEELALTAELGSTHEVVIDGRPYDLLVNPDLARIKAQSNSFYIEIRDQLDRYPQLSSGAHAFILEPNSLVMCRALGNCLGWAMGTFSFRDPVSAVWDRREAFLVSLGVTIPEGEHPDTVYGRQAAQGSFPPPALWDFFMKAQFEATPTDSESAAHLALYGSGFRNTSEGPSHIAFKLPGGSFWLSKPSDVSKPVLHARADQMAGGQMGDTIRLYQRAGGPLSHIAVRPKAGQQP